MLLFRRRCPTQNQVDAGAASRPFTRRDRRLISPATPIHFTRRGRCNNYGTSAWHGTIYGLSFLDETALQHLERREYQSRPTCDCLRDRSDRFTDRRCTTGFAWSGVHRHSGRPRYSCHRVHVGSALAKKSSSHGEQCCFQPRPRTSDSRGFQALRRAAARLIKTCLWALWPVNPLPMTIHSRVIRVSIRKREECLPRRGEE